MFSWLKKLFGGDSLNKAIDVGRTLVNGAGREINKGLNTFGITNDEQKRKGDDVLNKISGGIDKAAEYVEPAKEAFKFATDLKDKFL